jgi:flagellar motor switch protein FliM
MTQSQSITWKKLKEFKAGDVLSIRNTIEKDGQYGKQIIVFATSGDELYGINANSQIKEWIEKNGHLSEGNGHELVIGKIIPGDEPKYDKVEVTIRSAEIPF